jgi:hypothetical protein
VLSNNDVLIGWGDTGYVSEFTSTGNSEGNGAESLLYDVQFPGEEKTYRAFRSEWTGVPLYPPNESLSASNSGGTDVYASWNGSTETAAWRVLGGATPESLSAVSADVSSTGFETLISVDSTGPFFQVQAIGSDGQVLGASLVNKVH